MSEYVFISIHFFYIQLNQYPIITLNLTIVQFSKRKKNQKMNIITDIDEYKQLIMSPNGCVQKLLTRTILSLSLLILHHNDSLLSSSCVLNVQPRQVRFDFFPQFRIT